MATRKPIMAALGKCVFFIHASLIKLFNACASNSIADQTDFITPDQTLHLSKKKWIYLSHHRVASSLVWWVCWEPSSILAPNTRSHPTLWIVTVRVLALGKRKTSKICCMGCTKTFWLSQVWNLFLFMQTMPTALTFISKLILPHYLN